MTSKPNPSSGSGVVPYLSNKDGLILVYKESGMTSKDVSRWFQRKFGKLKIGHVGTLDPLAEGLLPILLGRATRLQDFLLMEDKVYEFDITFGMSTDTQDTDGKITDLSENKFFSLPEVSDVCGKIEGYFDQVPPLYSAIKFKGKPLYSYARNGKEDSVPLNDLKKTVQIYRLECLSVSGEVARFQLHCSKGTYVRAVAVRISEKLGTVGTVSRLLRVASGSLHSRNALKLSEIELRCENITRDLIPIDDIPLNIPFWRSADCELVKRLKMGQEMHVEMRFFESGLLNNEQKRVKITSLDHVLLFDNNGQSFGIGSAAVLNTGRIAVRMRRGLS